MTQDIRSVEVLGYPLLAVNTDRAERMLLEAAQAGQGGWWVTVNLHVLAMGKQDERLQTLLRRADFFLADGMPLVWFARLAKGGGLPERVTGTDLTPRLIREAVRRGLRLAVIGGQDPQGAVRRFAGEQAAVQVFGENLGPISATEFPRELVDKLRASPPHLILLALGCPRQDWLAERLREACPRAVLIGVGSAIDVASGHLSRAPRWMQNAGLEWFYRFTQQPKTLAYRYLWQCPIAFGRLCWWALTG